MKHTTFSNLKCVHFNFTFPAIGECVFKALKVLRKGKKWPYSKRQDSLYYFICFPLRFVIFLLEPKPVWQL